MTIADLLYQAGFWQWIGMFMLLVIVGNLISETLIEILTILRRTKK